jgi:hypothetical protein
VWSLRQSANPLNNQNGQSPVNSQAGTTSPAQNPLAQKTLRRIIDTKVGDMGHGVE